MKDEVRALEGAHIDDIAGAQKSLARIEKRYEKADRHNFYRPGESGYLDIADKICESLG